ncbi:MAG: helix-turn-helix transcriptional regulator [Clostridiales bacterium]|nr:helix-turn-helix transcriptional regulator [Clostridiales bacterium]
MLRIMLIDRDIKIAQKIRNKIPNTIGHAKEIHAIGCQDMTLDLSHVSNPNINNKVTCVGIGDTLASALALYEKYHPHLAICSCCFVQGTALELIGHIREKEKNMHFVVYDTSMNCQILRQLIFYGVDAFFLYQELMDGKLIPILEEVHRRTLAEATRRQFFFEKAIMDMFNNNTQNYLRHQDYLFFEKLKIPYYFVYFERDILSSFDEMSGKMVSFENDNYFFKKVYSAFEFLVDTHLYVAACMKVRQFRYLLVCEPLKPFVPMTAGQLKQSALNFKNQLRSSGLGGSMSFMIYEKAMSLEAHMELYGRTKFQFYNKYWYHRPALFFIDPGKRLVMEDYKIDYNYLDTLILTKNMEIYDYLDKVFEPGVKARDYAGFKMLFCNIENYLQMNYQGKYVPSFRKETLRYASLQEIITWLKMNIANLMEYRENDGIAQHSELVEQIIDFIKKSYGNPNLTLAQIAGSTRYQSNYLNIIFKKAVGCTIMDFVGDFRVRVARHLLMNHELSVKEIASSVGFHSPQYFAATFKRRTGRTPKEFRFALSRHTGGFEKEK